jgi:hypothetical protein
MRWMFDAIKKSYKNAPGGCLQHSLLCRTVFDEGISLKICEKLL